MSLPIVPQRAIMPRGLALLRTRAVVALAWPMTLLPPALLESAFRTVVHRSRPSSHAQARRIRAAVCAVSSRCAGEGCLQRSIAVFLLCRLEGHSPAWKTGYRLEPFTAHAWVEVDGEPVDEPSAISSYIPVLSVSQPGTAS
ncbi:lasso peptide biosynthesis B2 protein [Paenarthrobacter sp. NPDC089714]|uniref:lasso peptide biosynthesis B2 protein n=1 Tax=Paenarthrobacter sp. NPDC089714 TaxID=3364377 RepID=UPI00381A4345